MHLSIEDNHLLFCVNWDQIIIVDYGQKNFRWWRILIYIKFDLVSRSSGPAALISYVVAMTLKRQRKNSKIFWYYNIADNELSSKD